MTDMYNLSLAGGAGDWRKREINELSDLIQNRFHHLQVSREETGGQRREGRSYLTEDGECICE